MSRRVTLSNEDIELIRWALIQLHASSILNPEAFPEYALASKQRMDQIRDKLGIEHG